jgi:putative ABC transport system permease protein
MLSVIGIVTGIVFSVIMIQIVEHLKIMTEMPGASTPFQIKIYFMFSSVIYASCLASVTTIIATLIPALRASRMDIVEALRKNI